MTQQLYVVMYLDNQGREFRGCYEWTLDDLLPHIRARLSLPASGFVRAPVSRVVLA